MFIFKSPLQPVLENYLTEYMETTQHQINESISLQQFMTIQWAQGLPSYLIAFISQVVGNTHATATYFNTISKGLCQLTNNDLDRV